MSEQDIIEYLVPFDIASLIQGDEMKKDGLETIGKGFGNNLVDDIE